MNSKSENAVQNTNTASTSEERSQAHSPVVISRRRLLRAGVSGIPILLTMHGLAPGQTINFKASAASALDYDGHKIYETFSGYAKDNLVNSDENGFILGENGQRVVVKSRVKVNSSNVTLYYNNETTDYITLTGKSGVDIGTLDYYLRKTDETGSNYETGEWVAKEVYYTDLNYTGGSSTIQNYVENHLSDFFTIPDGGSISSVSASWTSKLGTSVQGSDGNYYGPFKAGIEHEDYEVTITSITVTVDGKDYTNSSDITLTVKDAVSETTDTGTGGGTDSGD